MFRIYRLKRCIKMPFAERILFTKFRILFIIIFLTLFTGEFIIYYATLATFCAWPPVTADVAKNNAVRAMILSDTHLLGLRQGHWFDKLRREWQMERTFQTALTVFNPDIIFVLGDLFDEGHWASREEIDTYAQRFRKMFSTNGRPLHAAVGNHDVGFHYAITERKLKWFYENFNIDAIRLIEFRGLAFVLVNSMAFEGDHCRFCADAERQLNEINRTFTCVLKGTKSSHSCSGYHNLRLSAYTRPILLQHFPLYRYSDALCDEPDEAPVNEKQKMFRQRWDCLSEEATATLLQKLHPRVAFSGHSHFGCLTKHTKESIPEYTIGSFSCRNTKNPSFMLGIFTPDNFSVSKCLSVRENTVYGMYIFIFIVLPVFYLFYVYCFAKYCLNGSRKKI